VPYPETKKKKKWNGGSSPQCPVFQKIPNVVAALGFSRIKVKLKNPIITREKQKQRKTNVYCKKTSVYPIHKTCRHYSRIFSICLCHLDFKHPF
jgi:hypothetical protein